MLIRACINPCESIVFQDHKISFLRLLLVCFWTPPTESNRLNNTKYLIFFSLAYDYQCCWSILLKSCWIRILVTFFKRQEFWNGRDSQLSIFKFRFPWKLYTFCSRLMGPEGNQIRHQNENSGFGSRSDNRAALTVLYEDIFQKHHIAQIKLPYNVLYTLKLLCENNKFNEMRTGQT